MFLLNLPWYTYLTLILGGREQLNFLSIRSQDMNVDLEGTETINFREIIEIACFIQEVMVMD